MIEESFPTTINVRIRGDQKRKINESGMNISQFIRDKLDEEFETDETLNQKEQELLHQIEDIKKKKGRLKDKPKDQRDEEKYLKQMKEHSKMYGIEDALDNYNQKFGKKVKMEKFRELIDD